MLKTLKTFSRTEKIIGLFLFMIVFVSAAQVVWRFFYVNSEIIATEGGIYTEGIVGQIKFLNPVYSQNNPVDRDFTQLIFSGLTKYDTKTKRIIPDLASYTLSRDKKIYKFTILDNALWHDGYRVSANDVLYTYKTVIQNKNFKNTRLKANFSKVKIRKINEKKIEFILEKPYKFFISNLTIGILPKHLLQDIPVKNLDLSYFNQSPIGTGPYKFKNIISSEGSTDVILERFQYFYGEKPKISTLHFKVFPDFKTLLAYSDNLTAVKNIPDEFLKHFKTLKKMRIFKYELPQYTAAFINTESEYLKDTKTRLGLQLSTNKKEITDNLSYRKIIDTPLLEIDQSNWVYEYDLNKARGAFFDTQWQLQDKDDNNIKNGEKEINLTSKESNDEVTYINSPNQGKNYITGDSSFYIKGLAPNGTVKIKVGDYILKLFKKGSKNWSYLADESLDNLHEGENEYKVYAVYEDGREEFLDKIIINLIKDKEKLNRAIEEQKKSANTHNEILQDKQEKKKENEFSSIRKNKEGKSFTLNLITSDKPKTYSLTAEILQRQWRKAGVDLRVQVLPYNAFLKKVASRDYDILLFGQNLGYNLDSYPYWHSSQANEIGFNLSQFKNFKVDTLLEEIRQTHNDNSRIMALQKLRKIIRDFTPAIFLYSPTYHYAVDKKVKGVNIKNLAIMSDRFNSISKWHIKERLNFKPGKGWKDLWGFIKENL